MILRVPVWIEQLMCFVFKSATVFQWIRRNCRVRRRESVMGMRSQRVHRRGCSSPLDAEMIGQLLTGSVVSTCPVDYATSVSLQMEGGKIVNDKNCIEQVQQIMVTTPGFDIVLTEEPTYWT